MKKLLYFVIILSLTACTTKKSETAQGVATTPNGIADLQNNSVPASTNNTSGNLLVNPEHGQPGHDCSIAVGAPFKKSTTNSVSDNSPTNEALKSEAAQLAKPEVSTEGVAEGIKTQKMNPAHGQPNHRCDIAVGAPLS